ncbi:PAX3- and PAX7-binding protein 1-like [Saccoglossus kowalevskii]
MPNIDENKKKESLLASSYSLFEDVVEEFSTFEGIKPHFEKWKHQYSDSYKEAYISLCLPKLFSPFIRLQLLNWNPLEPHCVDIEEMRWFESLIFYGFREYDGIDKEDLDNKLMPSLVEKVILPKLTSFWMDSQLAFWMATQLAMWMATLLAFWMATQ